MLPAWKRAVESGSRKATFTRIPCQKSFPEESLLHDSTPRNCGLEGVQSRCAGFCLNQRQAGQLPERLQLLHCRIAQLNAVRTQSLKLRELRKVADPGVCQLQISQIDSLVFFCDDRSTGIPSFPKASESEPAST